MKITAILVLRTPGDASTSSSGGVDGEQQQAAVLANASDVSRFGFFQRPAAREFIVFVARAVALRTATGRRQTVQHEEYKVHCCNPNGLCAVIFTDEHYPDRTAHSILIKVLEEYQKNFGESWRTTKDDAAQPWQYLDDALTKYQGLYMQQQQQQQQQQPQQQQQQATKSVPLACLETGLLKDFLTAQAEIHPATGELIITNETLIELKNKLHKDIASVLERGEQLDILVPKSSDLSAASQMFYNQAKKTRSMCTIL